MQPYVLEDLQRIPPSGILVTVAKHRSPDLRINNLFLESVTFLIHKKYAVNRESTQKLCFSYSFGDFVWLLSHRGKLSLLSAANSVKLSKTNRVFPSPLALRGISPTYQSQAVHLRLKRFLRVQEDGVPDLHN